MLCACLQLYVYFQTLLFSFLKCKNLKTIFTNDNGGGDSNNKIPFVNIIGWLKWQYWWFIKQQKTNVNEENVICNKTCAFRLSDVKIWIPSNFIINWITHPVYPAYFPQYFYQNICPLIYKLRLIIAIIFIERYLATTMIILSLPITTKIRKENNLKAQTSFFLPRTFL